MSVDILSEIIGARSKWVQMNPGKLPNLIRLSQTADSLLCSHLNQPSGGGFFKTREIVTCSGHRIFDMDIEVVGGQQVLVAIAQRKKSEEEKAKDRNPDKPG